MSTSINFIILILNHLLIKSSESEVDGICSFKLMTKFYPQV